MVSSISESTVPGGQVIESRRLGIVPYQEALVLQERLVTRRRRREISDQLLLLEHPHILTLGSAADEAHVLVDASERAALGLELAQTGRGGDVTYHGPGQLVGYPILDLNPDRRDIHRYLRDLEDVLIRTLVAFDIEASRVPEKTGVWTPEGKIGAIGIRVSSGWVTSHGFALNVSTDLTFFDTIVPCGLEDRRVTSVEALVGREVGMTEVMDSLEGVLARVFKRAVVPAEGLP